MCKRQVISLLAAAIVFVAAVAHPSEAADPEPLAIRVVGGLGGLKQYVALEEPFWSKELHARSGGRIKATVHPYDRSGLRGQDMLQLMRLGVVPFGTASVALVAGDEPLISAVDLPGLNPDFATLRRNVALFRPRMEEQLRTRYGIELLAVYAYPAQVVFCARPFAGLQDLWGRRVRTSSVNQSEMVSALGAIPIILPLAEARSAIERGVVDCAVTGTLSGFEIGISEVTTHVHTMALNWGLSVFGANVNAWQALPEDARKLIGIGVADLEARIWEAAERDTTLGLQCNSGEITCGTSTRRNLTIVPTSPADEMQRQQFLYKFVVPGWFDRCGSACEQAWSETIGPAYDAGSVWVRAAGSSAQGSR